MRKGILLTTIILSLLSLSCSVDRNKVGDEPPQFLRVSSYSGPVFGNISIYSNTKLHIGNSASAFVFQNKNGEEKEKNNQHGDITSGLRVVSALIEPITMAQLSFKQNESFAEQCGLKELEAKEHKSSEIFCDRLTAMKVLEPDYRYCGVEFDEESQLSETQCDCLEHNSKLVRETLETYKYKTVSKMVFNAKGGLANCAWDLINKPDPSKEGVEGSTKYWLLGDTTDQNGNKDKGVGDQDDGTRLSILSDGKGGAKVILDLMKFNGVQYSTEDRGDRKYWGEIKDAVYDMGKDILTFELIEQDQEGKLTDRSFQFTLARSQPFKFIPSFSRFDGEMVMYKKGKLYKKGRAKIDGLIEEEAQEDELISEWERILEERKRIYKLK